MRNGSRAKRVIGATALGVGVLLGPPGALAAGRADSKPLEVSGKVRCAEPVAWPPGATARVTLVEVDPTGAPGMSLAETTIKAVGKKAAPFKLHLARTNDGTRTLGVTVRVCDGDGTLCWITGAPYPLTAGARNRGLAVVVTRAADVSASEARTRSIVFVCDGSRFTAQIARDVAQVELPSRRLDLSRAWAAPGEEYGSGGTTLRVNGDAVRFGVNGRNYRNCSVVTP